MNSRRFTFVSCLALLLLAGCATAPRPTLTQYSTIDALLAGAYDGQVTLRELLRHGDTGLGTFDKLDGEMIVLDGVVYQVRADGRIARPALSTTTPFASVVPWRPETRFDLRGPMPFEKLQAALNAAAPNTNVFCVVRVHGRFSAVKTRSVPAQQKPYPPLVEVAKNQPVFERTNVSGTLTGFRSPVFLSGVTVPGYHLHFLSDDRTFGGHVLSFTLEDGKAELAVCRRFTAILPEDDGAFGALNLGEDRSKELHHVEMDTHGTP